MLQRTPGQCLPWPRGTDMTQSNVALPTTEQFGYVCFYNGKRIELHAASLFAAQEEAVRRFNPPKSKRHMVHCHLAEKDGQPVVHSTASLG